MSEISTPARDRVRSGGVMFVRMAEYPPRQITSLPPATRVCKVVKRGFFERDYVCGHRDSRTFKVNIFGITSSNVRQKDDCPECFMENLKKHVIFCALCGHPIVPGNCVALYDDDNEDIREDATHVDNTQVIGCMRDACCIFHGFLAGFWSEEGFVPLKFD